MGAFCRISLKIKLRRLKASMRRVHAREESEFAGQIRFVVESSRACLTQNGGRLKQTPLRLVS